MIELNNVCKQFTVDFWKKPKCILDHISTTIPAGVITGFLGENGAGKTTMMKIILNFIKADSGQIRFDPALGDDITKIYSHIAFMPERPYFYAQLTGLQFADYMGKLQGLKRNDLNLNITKWSEKLEIAYAMNLKIKHYSKGMLQKLGLLCCLLHSPKFLILDEPLSGIDPYGRKVIKDILIDLSANQGVGILFSGHILSDMEEFAHQVLFLGQGKIIYSGTVQAFQWEKYYVKRGE